MHELSIAMSIIDVAAEEAERLGATVVAVRLKLGPLSGVVKEALLSAYELAREQTPLAQSQLQIEEIPIVANCSTCGEPRPVMSIQELCCAVCGTPTPDILTGRELEVVGLEILESAPAQQMSHPG